MTYPEGLTPEERKRQNEEREKDLARLVKRWQKTHEADDLLRIYDMAKRVMARQAPSLPSTGIRILLYMMVSP